MKKDEADQPLDKISKKKTSQSKISTFLKIETSKLKTIFMVIASALLIGSMLGFMMIKMITNFDSDLDNQAIVASTDLNNNENTVDKEPNLKMLEMKQITGFVLQVGMFSEIENAKKWESSFKDAGFKSLIWQRANNYYLLAGISPTKDQAQVIATQIKESGFDVYVKEWNTDKLEKEVTPEEEDWMNAYLSSWDETLQSISDEDVQVADLWKNLISDYPNDSKDIMELVNIINNHTVKELDNINEQSRQYFLLDLWYHYETLFD